MLFDNKIFVSNKFRFTKSSEYELKSKSLNS